MSKSEQSSVIRLIFSALRLAIHLLKGMILVLFSFKGMLFFTGGIFVWLMIWSIPYSGMWIDRPLSRVKVYGDLIYVQQIEIENLLRPYVADSFLSVDLDKIRSQLRKNLWIQQVSVRRVWPDELKVELTEKKVVAKWQEQALINSYGEVFYSNNMDKISALLPVDLPKLSGEAGTEKEVMAQYMIFSSYLRALNLPLSEVKKTALGGWVLEADSVMLLLGRKAVIERIARFNSLYRRHLKKRWQDIKQVDLRYRDGAAVTWKQSDVIE